MAYTIKSGTRMTNLKPRHLFTTQEVKVAVDTAMKSGYVAALSKRHSSSEGCGASLDITPGYQPYDDVTVSFHTLKDAAPKEKYDVTVTISIPDEKIVPHISPLPPTTPPPPAPIPEPTPPPKIPEANVLPLVPDEETQAGSSDEEVAEESAPVNTPVYIKRCKRVRCERERYKKQLCKSHYQAWRKKNPWN